MNIRRPILVLLVAFICQFCAGQEITVAAAADLQSAMQKMAARFERETGKTVKLTYGSSGNFFQRFKTASASTSLFARIWTTPGGWKPRD